MSEYQDDSWKDGEFRKKTTEKIELVLIATGMRSEKVTCDKLEAGIFSKSDTKEKYMYNVERVISHLRQKANIEPVRDQNQKIFHESNQDEKQDEMEKTEISSFNTCDQKMSSTVPESMNQVPKRIEKDPTEMEGALKRLTLAENMKIKAEKEDTSFIPPKNIESTFIPPNPAQLLTHPSELRITQVYENIQQPPVLPPYKPDIRIAQVRGAFHSNMMPRNAPQLPQRRISDPPSLNFGIRSTVPRISNVTSLNRSQVWESPPQRPSYPMHSQPRLPPPNNSRTNMFDESKRFKYRESMIRRMLATEETVFNKARNEEQYINFFQNLFVETSNQVNLSPELQFNVNQCPKCKVSEPHQNLYQLLINEPEQIKYAISEEFKTIDLQIKTILRNLTADPEDISIKDVKLLPDEFERNISVFCAKMTSNYTVSERSDVVKID